ncbi:putative pentatricopeptide repeat-containing protein At5g09950 [Selaginella moellendorffii]|uniref:putative pentatricopeptide repeat-containing protein At5g09950 n=1 Tax=Selaginella moellendorffii TaxID=88036 RepID=UPI000D1D11A2|nr:putative pentatricopeptide repeat-containing protein At5g09950 [Selaginella moellendorffii]XP_024537617.1 putative pentatricopeptide repeat-containing protein At5g09950 [Selaginella moellendorffii]XP_024537623.1 putative pentatricopeptide repeat-containing protein At5g09950 [Selaginella moellendorffii]|eukprot:XP_024537609.1 putative pentatricopeptide repeat-containing protein At5g09950 [Selaginella moellendorffii]
MRWRHLQIRGFYTAEYIGKKKKLETKSLAAGCLDFLAQSLTKIQPSQISASKEQRSWQDACADSPDDQFAEDDEEPRPAIPVIVRECWDPQLRASVDQILQLKMRAHPSSYFHAIRDCTSKKALLEGTMLHAHLCKGGFKPSTVLGNLLIQMYGVCGRVDDARAVYDTLEFRNVFSSNIMIAAYAHNGHLQDAVDVFQSSRATNVVTWNTIVAAYARNGGLEEAAALFERTPGRNVVSWNNMISAYAHSGHRGDAIFLFRKMDLEGMAPNRVTFLHALDSCSSVGEGLCVHGEMLQSSVEFDVAVGTGLVIMYGRCGYAGAARFVFDRLGTSDVVVWTAMIVAYAQAGDTFDARSVFDRMPARSSVTWNAMVAAYAFNANATSALAVFKLMDLEGVPATKISFICALDACSSSSLLAAGKTVHANAIDSDLGDDLPVANAIINMYARCRDLERAKEKFSSMPRKNLVSWSAMVSAYAHCGQSRQGFETFQAMQLEGLRATEVTLCSVLAAASGANKFLDGVTYFLTVPEDYGFQRIMDHYVSVADMLARSGVLDHGLASAKNDVDCLLAEHRPLEIPS